MAICSIVLARILEGPGPVFPPDIPPPGRPVIDEGPSSNQNPGSKTSSLEKKGREKDKPRTGPGSDESSLELTAAFG